MTVAIDHDNFGIELKRVFWLPGERYFLQSPHSGDCNSTSTLY